MRIGLAAYEFRNGDTAFNLSQMEKGMAEAAGKADLLCFGEAFLQGFDALCWDYESDRHVAVKLDSPEIARLSELTVRYGVDLLAGYIERDGGALYSSCAVIEQGRILHNYRRITKNWKEFRITDHHYREGSRTEPFFYRGVPVQIALCGDLWIAPEKFGTDGLLIWPVYVNFSLEEWAQNEADYAQQALLAARRTVMVNSITRDPPSHGNAFYFENGRVKSALGYDREGILLVEM